MARIKEISDYGYARNLSIKICRIKWVCVGKRDESRELPVSAEKMNIIIHCHLFPRTVFQSPQRRCYTFYVSCPTTTAEKEDNVTFRNIFSCLLNELEDYQLVVESSLAPYEDMY